jgi:hypothetical protein
LNKFVLGVSMLILMFLGCAQKDKHTQFLITVFKTKGTFGQSFAYLGPGQLNKASESLQTDNNQLYEIDYYPGTVCYVTKNTLNERIGYFTSSQFGNKVVLVASNHKYNVEGILLQKTIQKLMKDEGLSVDSCLTLLSSFLWSKIPMENENIKNDSGSDIEKNKYKKYLLEKYNLWKTEKTDFLIVQKMSPIDKKDSTLIVFDK